MAVLNGGPVRESAQKISLEERRNQINTSSLCRAMLHFTSKEEGEKVQGHKQSKRSADYDYSGESDTLSKKLDYLFANEGIRFKRNQNATSGSGSSYLVRLYVPPSTTKPGILQQLSRHLGSTVAFSPMATTTASFGTSATSSFSPTSATPRLAQSSSSSSGTSSTHSAHPMPRRPTLIGQLLMLHRFGELNNRDYAPTKWMLYNNHDQGSSSLPLVESNLELFNSAEQLQPTRILVKNLVKKNPFDKEGIRFKRGLETDAEVGSFELSNNGYPFVNEGEQNLTEKALSFHSCSLPHCLVPHLTPICPPDLVLPRLLSTCTLSLHNFTTTVSCSLLNLFIYTHNFKAIDNLIIYS